MKTILDSSAWIEYFGGTEKGRKISNELAKNTPSILITGVIVSEVLMKFLRDGMPVEHAFAAMQSMTRLVPFDFNIATKTAHLYVDQRKRQPKLSLIDAHVAAVAKAENATLFTTDHDFEGISEAVII